ncbi:hypothetical protein IH992_32035 [Candidatus Poribacteria bacterium]|nr:hypothetical protein [Candidatus Poribacteria bacterium]
MTSVNQSSLNQLTTEFQRFREDALERFRVKLRLFRASQIQQLLSTPIDLETFNREVWWSESYTPFRGKDISRKIFNLQQPLDATCLSQLEQALDSGELELHGNYTWGSATRTYYPRIKDKSRKVKNIHQAIAILNDSTLSPDEKAERILEIDGFGPNSGTGLVMLFHPTEFAIYNIPSKQALEGLGYQVGNITEFKKAICQLFAILKADSFIELDRFLYLIDIGEIDLDEKSLPPPRVNHLHTEIQWWLAKLGREIGGDVWIAANDHRRKFNDQPLNQLSLDALPPLGIKEETQGAIRLIDVLWLDENEVTAAFEIECTTSIYSGLLRLSDLLASSPNLITPLYIVAPEKRRNQVRRELLRPTFKRLKLHEKCRYIPAETFVQQAPSMTQWISSHDAIKRLAEDLFEHEESNLQ